jgi:hypothetical protein
MLLPTNNILVCSKKGRDAIFELSDLKSFKPQALSNTVWSYATADIRHPGLFKKVSNAIAELKDLQSFNPQNLSNTVWVQCTANAIIELKDLKSFDPQILSNTVWKYATLNNTVWGVMMQLR